MRFTVSHVTRYSYSAPVQLAPHLIRLNPRSELIADLTRILTIDPAPIRRQDRLDAHGNTVTRVAFEGSCTEFRVESRFSLKTRPAEPPPPAALPPLPWPVDHASPLAAYLTPPDAADPVNPFAADLAVRSGQAPLAFLEVLTQALFSGIDRHIRPVGDAQPPAVTLQTARGACRDITVLFIAACRSLGIPARFTSGYKARAETPDGQRHLHAWPEVHLPGYGWLGMDPTHGQPVSDGHVALASAPDQAGTMPIEGGFFGTEVTSRLSYRVEIEALP